MPEVVLCCDCKQSINKETDQYVVIRKETPAQPEQLAHVACEQRRASRGAASFFDDLMRRLKWPY